MVEVYTFLSTDKEPPALASIAFRVDAELYERDAKFRYSEMDEVFETFTVIASDDALIDALRGGRTLVMSFVDDNPEAGALEVSLVGAARAIDEGLGSC